MKKLLSAVLALFVVAGCSSKASESFKGKTYKMTVAPANMEITIGFDAAEPRFHGKALNNYFGGYTLDGDKLTFGPAGSTMMAGPEEMMKAEHEYLQTLPKITGYTLEDGKLILTGTDNVKLEFEEVTSPAK